MKKLFLLRTLLPITLSPAWRTYATQSRMTELRTAHPAMGDSISAIERFTPAFRRTGRVGAVMIPVVVHVLPLSADSATQRAI